MKALHTTSKPVIFVMQTSSALAIHWEKENLPAIINTWYGGQAVGEAVADVLFGDYNPAGRLPVTFYKSDDNLPTYDDYSMRGRTYRYFEKDPLFPFGYGLSYSAFEYSGLSIPKTLSIGKDIIISVTVKNTGKYDGEEVVQLYLKYKDVLYKSSQCYLKGFKCIFLKKGGSTRVSFKLRPTDMSQVDKQGKLIQSSGQIEVFVGGGQPTFFTNGQKSVLNVTGQNLVLD